MRDILISVIVFGLLPFILRSPKVGAYVWAWMSLMNPHRAAFGFARELPFAQVIAGATLIPFLFSKERKPLPINSITVLQFLLLFWMGVTSLFALNTGEVVLGKVALVAKIQIMLFVTMMLMRGRQDIERLIWVVTLSIGFYGIKGGIWTVLTGGAGRVWGPTRTMIEGNNELAIALVMVTPFLYYLWQVSTRRWLRWALVASMLIMAFAIMGTQSRGALLALGAMAVLLGLSSKHPVRMLLGLAVVAAVAVAFMPDSWLNRMETIQTYEGDGSAMSRLYTWETLWNVAKDRPLLGAGFGTDNPALFARYAPFDGSTRFGNGGIFVAHSIYFQALGEHGFPGLILYLLLGIVTWRKATKLARITKNDPDFGNWVPLLMPMVKVSLFGFAVGGAFLTMMHFDFPYYIMCYVVLVDATIAERNKRRATLPSFAPNAGPAGPAGPAGAPLSSEPRLQG